MVALIIGMLICVVLALAIVALVAVPARRQGRDIFTPKGDDVVSALKDRQTAVRQRLERGEEQAPSSAATAPETATAVHEAPAVEEAPAPNGAYAEHTTPETRATTRHTDDVHVADESAPEPLPETRAERRAQRSASDSDSVSTAGTTAAL